MFIIVERLVYVGGYRLMTSFCEHR